MYVQYVYDTEGNKVCQFIGMAEPPEITVAEVPQEEEIMTKGIKQMFRIVGIAAVCVLISGCDARETSVTSTPAISSSEGAVVSGSGSNSKNDEKESSNESDVLNQYFPYKSGQCIKMNARLLFLGYLEGTVSLKFVMKRKGTKGEIWEALMYNFSEVLKESETDMAAYRKKIAYLFVQKDKIFWIYHKMTGKEIKRACKKGKLPKVAQIICQENEQKDNNKKQIGEHSILSAIGKDIREFRFWVISQGNGEGYGIRRIVLKKGVGLIGYRISETSAGRNSLELWNEEYVQSESYADFKYKDSGEQPMTEMNTIHQKINP